VSSVSVVVVMMGGGGADVMLARCKDNTQREWTSTFMATTTSQNRTTSADNRSGQKGARQGAHEVM
jgi:hypothetical protein